MVGNLVLDATVLLYAAHQNSLSWMRSGGLPNITMDPIILNSVVFIHPGVSDLILPFSSPGWWGPILTGSHLSVEEDPTGRTFLPCSPLSCVSSYCSAFEVLILTRFERMVKYRGTGDTAHSSITHRQPNASPPCAVLFVCNKAKQ